MSADLAASAYLVDGVDLSDGGAELTHEGAGLWSGLAEELSPNTFPGFDGGVETGGAFRPFTASTMYTVRGSGYTATWAAVRALRRLCKPGLAVTLTRQVPDPEGSDTNVNQTAAARRVTDRLTWLGRGGCVVDIDWLLTDGKWYGASTNIPSAAGTQAIKGDVRTTRMTITLPAGVSRTVTNTTNGYGFTFTTGTPGGGTVIDVEARTATNIVGGADVSQYLEWGKVHPFRLDPGANVITVSAGSASIDYQPAYQ